MILETFFGSKSIENIGNYKVYCDRLEISKKHQELTFIAMWVTTLPKNIGNYNVYCDVALQDLFGPYKEARNH